MLLDMTTWSGAEQKMNCFLWIPLTDEYVGCCFTDHICVSSDEKFHDWENIRVGNRQTHDEILFLGITYLVCGSSLRIPKIW